MCRKECHGYLGVLARRRKYGNKINYKYELRPHDGGRIFVLTLLLVYTVSQHSKLQYNTCFYDNCIYEFVSYFSISFGC